MVEGMAFITFSRGLAQAVGPESHAPIHGQSQDLCGGADWDSGALNPLPPDVTHE